MPEYLSPGVYVEEVSFRQKTIEGVSTSTAGFVGPARFGPIAGEPTLVTNFGEFQQYYGGLEPLDLGGEQVNYLAQGVKAFFEEGGKRVYISRIYNAPDAEIGSPPGGVDAGVAWASLEGSTLSPPGSDLLIRARFPGAGGNFILRFAGRLGQNVATGAGAGRALRGVRHGDVVQVSGDSARNGLYTAIQRFDAALGRTVWRLEATAGSEELLEDLAAAAEVRVISLSLEIEAPTLPNGRGRSERWTDLGFDSRHARAVGTLFAEVLPSRGRELVMPIVMMGLATAEGPTVVRAIFGQARSAVTLARLAEERGVSATDPTLATYLGSLGNTRLTEADHTVEVRLHDGVDGDAVRPGDYEGNDSDDPTQTSGLRAFEHVADISIIAAPGHTGFLATDGTALAQVVRHLISHCERMRYRIAVLDSVPGQGIADVRAFRGTIDTSHAALYYPWIQTYDPATDQPILVPPSGAVAGIYARNDIERGVHKAPANEVLRTAIGLEAMLAKGHQDVINPEGINALRFFEGRGFRVWGARTASSDGEWRYVNLRRYFAYVERSIETSTQWAVFESNGDRLWRNVRQTVEDFLLAEWQSDRLLGAKASDAFFVRCDRSTMTQNHLDNGQLICLIGLAPLRPAEFVIFRIGQWTADRKS